MLQKQELPPFRSLLQPPMALSQRPGLRQSQPAAHCHSPPMAPGAVPAVTALSTVSGVGAGPVSVTLPAAGRYFITLNPVGSGDPVTTGYSTYGSRGQYELLVTYPSNGGSKTPRTKPL